MAKRIHGFTLRQWVNPELTESAPVSITPEIHTDLSKAVRKVFDNVVIGAATTTGLFIVVKKIGHYFTKLEIDALHNFCLGFLAAREL